MTARTILERLYLVLGLVPIGALSQLSVCSHTPPLRPRLFLDFHMFFFTSGPSFFGHHYSPSNLAEFWIPGTPRGARFAMCEIADCFPICFHTSHTRHLGSWTPANSVSFDFIVSCTWGLLRLIFNKDPEIYQKSAPFGKVFGRRELNTSSCKHNHGVV